ncbi:hypothetical protein MKEN_00443900 [Mycena kentingensis (nom. inval.)]|nr:hypothetical protein MKEN_00443900 [Mycena kentingensis (nom. inval.)]
MASSPSLLESLSANLNLGTVRARILEVSPSAAILSVLGIYAVGHAIRLWGIFNSRSYFPRIYTSFNPFGLPGVFIPTSSWSTGIDWHWLGRFKTYLRGETVQLVPLLGGNAFLWTSNVDVARQIVVGAHRSKWWKPESMTQALLMWGMNLVASDGLMWRKHRRIVGPAFSTELYKLVWQQSRETYNDFMNVEGWDREGNKSVEVPVIQDITMKFAFLIISNCGFGFPSSWATPPTTADGKLPIAEALSIVVDHNLLMTFAPSWIFALPISALRRIRQARQRMLDFMHMQVAQRKEDVAAGKELRADAFTALVQANQDEEGKYRLDADELFALIGNWYTNYALGHDTTAHTLAATLGFMAVNEEIQTEVVQQVLDVVGTQRDPVGDVDMISDAFRLTRRQVFEDYGKLDKVLAIFYEAARMFPAGHVLIREALEDTIIQVQNPVGEEGTTSVPISKGTTVGLVHLSEHLLISVEIVVDMVGVQYNPRYAPNPEEYRPSRWYGLPTDSEQFTAFSIAAAVRVVYNQPRELKKMVQLLYRLGWVQGRFKDIPSAFVQPETPLDCLRLVRLLQRDPFYLVWSARKKPRLADDLEVKQLRSLLANNEALVRFLSNAAAEPVNYPSSARVESTQVSVLSFLEFMAGYCINCVHKEILPDCEALRVFWTILNDGNCSYDPADFDVQMLRMHLNICGALPGSHKAWVEYTIEDYRWRFYPEYDGKCWPAAAPTSQ